MARAATKQMILCADDYGLAPEIDHAILNLGAAAQISAVSCMTGGPSWQQSAPLLRQTQGSLDLGLHFTLTEITPLGPMPHLAPTGQFPELATIIRCVILGQCDIGEIRAEAYRQMETFCQAIGRPPDHIDGHQHIHCFPRLRQITQELALQYGCYVRNSASRPQAPARAKAIVLNGLQSGFRRRLRQSHIAFNQSYLGLHGFDAATDLATLYRHWLTGATTGVLLNCHPGCGTVTHDRLAPWRHLEYAFLRSATAAQLRAEGNWQLSRFRQLAVPAV